MSKKSKKPLDIGYFSKFLKCLSTSCQIFSCYIPVGTKTEAGNGLENTNHDIENPNPYIIVEYKEPQDNKRSNPKIELSVFS